MSGCCEVTVSNSPVNVAITDGALDTLVLTVNDGLVIHDVDLDILLIEEPSIVVVSDCVGVPGPPGPQGPPGVSERVEFTVEAGFDLQAYRLVVPRVQEPNVRHGLPDFLPHADRPLWITLHAALEGEDVLVVSEGCIENPAWAWVQAPIYLGADGTLTQVVPALPGSVFSTQVGFPVTATSMYLNPYPAIILA